MKILKITEFSLEVGTGQTTTVELDARPGIIFEVVSSTFKTAPFTKDNIDIPVIMLHSDRNPANVTMNIMDGNLEIVQTYRQASFAYLIAKVPNDWADTNELSPVTIDSTYINKVTLNNGQEVEVSTSFAAGKVRLSTVGFIPSDTTYYSQVVYTSNGNQYICQLSWTAHQNSSSPITYDYIYTDVNRPLTAYTHS